MGRMILSSIPLRLDRWIRSQWHRGQPVTTILLMQDGASHLLSNGLQKATPKAVYFCTQRSNSPNRRASSR
jgi:hypothetical protein